MNLLFKLLLISSLFSITSQAQTPDKIATKCAYKLKWVKDTTNPQNTKEDYMILNIGNKVSEFYSYNTFKADSAMNIDIAKGVPALEIMAMKAKYGPMGMRYHIYKNLPSGKITVTDIVGSDNFKYEEPLKPQTWSILKDQTTILGYKCQKATCDFGGRHYTAWFTKEIPVSNGPWKFNGLPGLILKVEDSQKYYQFEMVGLQQISGKENIPTPDFKKCISTTKSQLLALERKFYADPIAYLNKDGNMNIVPGNPKANKARPYNPIELK